MKKFLTIVFDTIHLEYEYIKSFDNMSELEDSVSEIQEDISELINKKISEENINAEGIEKIIKEEINGNYCFYIEYEDYIQGLNSGTLHLSLRITE